MAAACLLGTLPGQIGATKLILHVPPSDAKVIVSSRFLIGDCVGQCLFLGGPQMWLFDANGPAGSQSFVVGFPLLSLKRYAIVQMRLNKQESHFQQGGVTASNILERRILFSRWVE